MALPTYATTGQRVGYYSFLTYCGLVFFFLIAPIFIILPLSFSASPFFEFTREMMTFDPDGYSLKWYKQMVNICGVEVTTVCTDKWMRGLAFKGGQIAYILILDSVTESEGITHIATEEIAPFFTVWLG